MRKIFAIVSFMMVCSCVAKAQYVNIPDINFRNFLQYQYPACFNEAGQMDTICSANISTINITQNIDISNWSGFQYLKSLEAATFYNGQYSTLPNLPITLKELVVDECLYINAIPPLPAGLKRLTIYHTTINSLPSLPNTLKYLECTHNRAVLSLPTLPNGLDSLNCPANLLTILPGLPPSLLYLNCSRNYISVLPDLPSGLKSLNCLHNSLSALPSLPDSLKSLLTGYNFLTAIPQLPNSLFEFDCMDNQILSIPALPPTLFYLGVSNNPIHSLPLLPNSLVYLFCAGSNLTVIPALPASLRRVDCANNNLTILPTLPFNLEQLLCNKNEILFLPKLPITLNTLDCSENEMSCLPNLPSDLRQIKMDDKISCIPNAIQARFTTLDSNLNESYYFNNYPLCTPLNNSYHCQSFPVMEGLAFYDNNSNGIHDTDEPAKNNLKVTLSNGRYTFTANSGYYQIDADSIGAYHITITPPQYFTVSPATVNFNFTGYDTLVTKNIPLQANTTIDELTIKITSINQAARPGFSFPYLISYENTGTTTLSPTIVFDYDQTRLNYNTSSVAGVVDNASTLTYNTGSLSPGQSGSFIGYFTLKTTVPLGDVLNAKATINANTFTAYDSVQTTVRGAFDPNDKQATPQLSPSQVANGEYIDYTIRFQNTGTDTAFTVVISDTLSDDLQANSLQMITSSHNCKTTVKDNIVFFEFLNILLPDSNINEPSSHGFVSFKMKPQTSVSANTTILNKAAIYFDYNAPVITNTAGTLIKDFIVLPLRLISFNAVPQNDNTTSLYWKTSNEINTQYFVVERSSDGSAFTSIANVFANGRASNQYNSTVADSITGIVFYRLKIVDNNGSFVYSPVVKIDRRKNTAGFSLLSNPVKDFIIINTIDRSLHNTLASIINMQGAVVKTFIVKEESQVVDINNLPNGVYLMRTVNGSSRIVIQ